MLVGSFPFSHYASAGRITTTGIYLISISLGMVGNSLSFWAAAMFLAAGFGSAAVLGFSPTTLFVTGIFSLSSTAKNIWLVAGF